MKRHILTFAAIAAITSFTSCSNNAVSNEQAVKDSIANAVQSMPEQAKEEGVMVGGALMVPSKNIVENALGSAEHTTLVAAVKAGELVEVLSGPGPFTVFAPTNDAFNALPAGTVDGLLKPEKKKDLVNVLTYHVVPGALKSTDLKDGMVLTTVQGKELKVTYMDGVWMINGAKVTIADVISSNGVTHVIDAVLLPPAK
ncbi:MAG: fasciclin domain-containing protein [Bacteroidota bacterium]